MTGWGDADDASLICHVIGFRTVLPHFEVFGSRFVTSMSRNSSGVMSAMDAAVSSSPTKRLAILARISHTEAE